MPVTKNHSEEAKRLLGPIAAMISASKTMYRREFPDHLVLFNARVFNDAGEEIWCGDLDLTKKLDELCELASIEGPILVGPEPLHSEGVPSWFSFTWDEATEIPEEHLRIELLFPFLPDRLEECRQRVIGVSEEIRASRAA